MISRKGACLLSQSTELVVVNFAFICEGDANDRPNLPTFRTNRKGDGSLGINGSGSRANIP